MGRRMRCAAVLVVAAAAVGCAGEPAKASFLSEARARTAIKGYAVEVGRELEWNTTDVFVDRTRVGACQRRSAVRVWCRFTVSGTVQGTWGSPCDDVDAPGCGVQGYSDPFRCTEGAVATLRRGRVRVADDWREAHCS
jgi:hypothetical protein